MTLSEARRILGNAGTKYSDEQLAEILVRIRKLAEIVYPITVEKLHFSSEK